MNESSLNAKHGVQLLMFNRCLHCRAIEATGARPVSSFLAPSITGLMYVVPFVAVRVRCDNVSIYCPVLRIKLPRARRRDDFGAECHAERLMNQCRVGRMASVSQYLSKLSSLGTSHRHCPLQVHLRPKLQIPTEKSACLIHNSGVASADHAVQCLQKLGRN